MTGDGAGRCRDDDHRWGEAIADIDTLRHQEQCCVVASALTVWRALDEVGLGALKDRQRRAPR
ncbi:MAG: hypothetical protein IPH27_14885 [Actinomycetales bacterium]|nr:hypothetical protein [Candidatus Phosphoribacter baldrii]